MEVIESGPGSRPPRRGVRLALAVLAAVAVVVGAVAVVTDRRVHERERVAVRACAAGVESAVTHARGRVTSTIRYVSPALGETAPEAVRADMRRLVREAAASGVAALADRRPVCTGVRARPWHDDVTAARDAWLGYLDAAQQQLADTAAGRRALTAPRPDLVQLHTRAQTLTP